MRKRSFTCLMTLIISACCIIACSPSKNKRIESINTYESKLLNAGQSIKKEQYDSLLNMFESFAKDFPKDSLAPGYLYKASSLYVYARNNVDKSIELLDKIISEYPDFKGVSECYFYKGFVYESANRVDEAHKAYQAFIEKYPDHYLAKDAQFQMQNLGTDPLELVKRFEAADSTNNIANK